MVRDVKESCCAVPKPTDDDDSTPMDTESESDVSASVANTTYELPDGTKVTIDPDIANLPGKVASRGL